ncbi:MAG: SMP-30/gluconolaconase/LRE-like region, partial [Acidimicrobiales bacterium]|nr:SMP-30/gluconolaconase/LRE-like region [Acidimicrobiales bacterium]
MKKARVALTGIGIPQALRWHDGALWFSDVALGTVNRWNGEGDAEAEVIADIPGAGGLGWLPDGRLLVLSTVDEVVYRVEQDGTLVTHADLVGLAGGTLNDMIVDAAGRAYVGNYGFDYEQRTATGSHAALFAPPGPATTTVACFDAGGRLLGESSRVLFPNGAAFLDGGKRLLLCETLRFRITAFDVDGDGMLCRPRLWASLIPPLLWKAVTAGGPFGAVTRWIAGALEHPQIARRSASPIAPDDIVANADGTVWIANSARGECVRIAHGGRVLDRIATTGHTLGVEIGGPHGQTLYAATVPTLDPVVSERRRRGAIEVFDLTA